MGAIGDMRRLAKKEATPCSICKKERRRMGSSSCQKCADIYHNQQFEASRVRKRIEEASKK